MRRAEYLAVLSLFLVWSGCECSGKIRSVESLPADPVQATANVAGAVKASSPNFRLITTTAPSGGAVQSPSFKVRSGVVAGTQSTTDSNDANATADGETP